MKVLKSKKAHASLMALGSSLFRWSHTLNFSYKNISYTWDTRSNSYDIPGTAERKDVSSGETESLKIFALNED